MSDHSQSNYDQVLRLRPLSRDDFHLLVNWINEPHVALWWDGPADINWVAGHYSPRLAENAPVRVYVAECSNKPIGFVKFYRHAVYPEWEKAVGIKNAAGIDYLIGESSILGQGFGAQMIRLIVPIIFNLYPDIDIIIAGPKRDNHASCRVLQKAGFKLIEDRFFTSDNPVHHGIKSIYGLRRETKNPPSIQ